MTYYWRCTQNTSYAAPINLALPWEGPVKRFLLSMVTIVLVTFSMIAPASAQGDQAISADPTSVSEAGEHELTVSGTGYTGPAFLLPCPDAEGDLTKVAEDGACDLNNLTPVAPDGDGNVEATVTFDIPDEGLVIVIGNADQSEVAVTLVTVGADEAEEEEADDADDAGDSDSDAATADDSDSDAATADDDALASTGAESFQFIVIGATMLLAGLMLARFSRRV